MVIPAPSTLFSSTKIFIAFIAFVFYFAYIMDMPARSLFILFVFCAELLLLKASYDIRRIEKLRLPIVALMTFSTLFYVMTLQINHPSWDAAQFFMDTQAVRHNQSPYSGPMACGMNQNFVPTFAVCAALGDSLGEFKRNLLRMDAGSALACGVMIGGGLIYFFRKKKLNVSKSIEISLQAIMLAALFYSFFKWNMVVGNISTWVAPLVLLIIGFHYLKRPIITGVMLGIAISIKPFLLTLVIGYGIHLLMKKDARQMVVLMSAFLLLVGTAVALQLFEGGLGFDTYIEFFTSVAPGRTSSMLMNIDNVSIPAMLFRIFKSSGIGNGSQFMTRFSLVLSLLAFGAGAYLSGSNPRRWMPADHIAYYVLLTTAIYPLVWMHYFSWLVGPAIYVLCKLSTERENRQLIPPFLLCCFIMTLDSLAWMGALALPILFFISVARTQKESIQRDEIAPATACPSSR